MPVPHATLALSVLLALAACGSPPPPANAREAAYQQDYAACDSAVPDAVAKRNAKTGHTWFASPFTRWSQISTGMSACMADKGWGRTRICTAEELRTGSNRTVTSDGIRCTDPATRS